MKFGIAIAARMPMIATTIISSIRVKPLASFFMVFILRVIWQDDLVKATWGPNGSRLQRFERAAVVLAHASFWALRLTPIVNLLRGAEARAKWDWVAHRERRTRTTTSRKKEGGLLFLETAQFPLPVPSARGRGRSEAPTRAAPVRE